MLKLNWPAEGRRGPHREEGSEPPDASSGEERACHLLLVDGSHLRQDLAPRGWRGEAALPTGPGGAVGGGSWACEAPPTEQWVRMWVPSQTCQCDGQLQFGLSVHGER